MSSGTVQKIKERLSIEEVIGSYLDLEKAGGNYKAKCPFHNERTPSFFVSPERGSYYCFGCGAKGDIFTFVEEFEGIDFVTTLKMLAERAGVPIERYGGQSEKDPKDRLYEATEEAAKFFQTKLKDDKQALMYLKNRSLSIETLRSWRLGFAPSDWRSLKTHLRDKSFSEKELLDAGLIKQNPESGKESYDRFRGRVMFPIFDTAGRVNAFSGRVLNKDEEPKYLNSPDTPLFDKSKSLYGYHVAKYSMREKGFALVVEGQMDLLMSHQAGLTNTVATSGTALTPYHLEMIKRITGKVVIAYDADNAGRNATWRAWKIALSLGLEVSIALLPDGMDPADVVAKDPSMWIAAVTQSKNVIDYFIEAMKLAPDTKGRDAIIKDKILPLVKSIESSIDQSRFIQKLSFESGIAESSLWQELAKVKEDEEIEVKLPELKQRSLKTIDRSVGYYLWLKGKSSPYADEFQAKLATILPDYTSYIPSNKQDESALLFEVEMHYGAGSNEKSIGEALLYHLEEETLKERFAKSMERLKKAEAVHDSVAVDNELRICQELSFRISKLVKSP